MQTEEILSKDFTRDKMFYMTFSEVMSYCSSSKKINKTCDAKFWYDWWSIRPQSYPDRTYKILRMLKNTSNDKINWALFNGSLKVGFDYGMSQIIPNVGPYNMIGTSISNNHLKVAQLFLEMGGSLPLTLDMAMLSLDYLHITLKKLDLLEKYLLPEQITYFMIKDPADILYMSNIKDAKKITELTTRILKRNRFNKFPQKDYLEIVSHVLAKINELQRTDISDAEKAQLNNMYFGMMVLIGDSS